jgi:hypothetical protein
MMEGSSNSMTVRNVRRRGVNRTVGSDGAAWREYRS